MPRNTATNRLKSPSGPQTFTLPHLYLPRSYQREVWKAKERGCKRFLNVWHRRAGKDKTWLNLLIRDMAKLPFCATYLHIFPELTQGRRDAWDAKSSPEDGGLPFRAHFPPGLIMESSETEMQITMKPLPHQKPQPIPDGHGGMKLVGSIYQVMGTNPGAINNLRGINAYGVVFSEYRDQDPRAWDEILAPVLGENGGWAAFISTPRGKNHLHSLYGAATSHPWPSKGPLSWSTQFLTIDDTKRDAPGEGKFGEPVITQEFIASERARGVAEEIIQQEYYCSFEGFLRGTIYGDLIRTAREQGRITQVPYDANKSVGVMMDIGREDLLSLWFYQVQGSAIRFIEYHSERGGHTDACIAFMLKKPYVYGRVTLPQDAKAETFNAPASVEWKVRRRMRCEVAISPKLPVHIGIDKVRGMFSRFVFDALACGRDQGPGIPSGLDALGNYHRRWDVEKQEYSQEPVHDQYSHGADALRTGIIGWREGLMFPGEWGKRQEMAESSFDPFAEGEPVSAVPQGGSMIGV